MNYTILGRTGLRVSRVGLGCGGHSRLGMMRGASEVEASEVVRAAVGMGINFIDTAESYGTEGAVRRGIEGVSREKVVISTKASVRPGWEGDRHTAGEFRERVEGCLRRLGTEYVDVFHVHGVRAEEYGYVRGVIRPELERLREEGKVRWVGITEAFGPDTTHAMLGPAVEKDGAMWDVVMVGHNVLNPSARGRVLVHTRRQRIGTLCMFAVRNAMSDEKILRETVRGLVERGEVGAGEVDVESPLGFLVGEGVSGGVAGSVVEAAYRFCVHEPGMDVVLSGTGNVGHLEENVRSLLGPRLPGEVLEKLERLFGKVDSVSGN